MSSSPFPFTSASSSWLTPKRTTLMPLRRLAMLVVGDRLCLSKSAMLRSASDSVPSWRDERQRLGLARREFERRGLADDDALAVLFLDRLVDREHPYVGEDRLADMDFDAGGLLGLACRDATG